MDSEKQEPAKVTPFYEDARVAIYNGDNIAVMSGVFPDNYFDAIVTDPPYGWRFMGKAWDGADIEKWAKARTRLGRLNNDGRTHSGFAESVHAGAYDTSLKGNKAFQVWTENWAREALRVLKPGGHILVFCGPRTYHRMASGVEDAGFEIRDALNWLFGSGFPKSFNLGDGWGTALKPACEYICLGRKPVEKGLTIAENAAKWGTGGLNIDRCRVEIPENDSGGVWGSSNESVNPERTFVGSPDAAKYRTEQHPGGRWPANVIHDGSPEVVGQFPDTASGLMKGGTQLAPRDGQVIYGAYGGTAVGSDTYADAGSAARFFYCAKADKGDREHGLDEFEARLFAQSNGGIAAIARGDAAVPNNDSSIGLNKIKQAKNHHPTVKPTDLMQWLCRLITPTDGLILDPFLGSGSTMKAALIERFRCVGIEMDAEYCRIAQGRIQKLQVNLF